MHGKLQTMQSFLLVPESEFQKINSKLDRLLSNKEAPLSAAQIMWLSNEEAMQFLHVSKSTMQTYRNRGYLKFSKVGRKIRYSRTDLQQFLESTKIK